jgi:hypothetical protein
MSDEGGTSGSNSRGRHPILEAFGMKLEVSNPRLAELLTMDAKEALTTDVRKLGSAREVRQARAEAEEAAPDVVMAPAVARDEEEARQRHEFRAAVMESGAALGFDAGADGVWNSPTGVTILTRAIERPMSFAAATHYVAELASRRATIAGPESSALFVVDGQQMADVFKVAVRQGRLHDVMRTISLDNLAELRRLLAAGALNHHQVVVLLAPVADIDAGELLSIMRASADE